MEVAKEGRDDTKKRSLAEARWRTDFGSAEQMHNERCTSGSEGRAINRRQRCRTALMLDPYKATSNRRRQTMRSNYHHRRA